MLILTTTLFASCKKDISASTDGNNVTASSTIAVAASETAAASGSPTDSVYIMQTCPRGSQRDSITAAGLPAGATAYLTTNYPGYTFSKAFAIKNSSGTTTAYVAIIYYNDKPVALLFDSTGTFVKVLEQREKGDIENHGWHEGGRFCDRDGLQKETVAMSSLTSVIIKYLCCN
jgi:hypothetical protein